MDGQVRLMRVAVAAKRLILISGSSILVFPLFLPDVFVPKAAAVPSVSFLTSGTSWSVPSDWNNSNNSIEVIGGGGGGFSAGGNQAGGGGGGGGGGYSKVTNLTLTGGTSVTVAIGSAGGADAGGGDTYFCNSTSNCANISGSAVQAGAKGGGGGAVLTGGTGGQASSGVGSAKFNGGSGGGSSSGGATSGNGGGGGGGAAGLNGAGVDGATVNNSTTGGNGGNGDNNSGGSGGAGSGSGAGTAGSAGTEWDATHGSGGGGGGGAGGGNKQNGFNGAAGGNYGAGGSGGGSGGKNSSAGGTGGAGKQGLIVITYEPVIISVTAADGSVAYGILSTSTSKNTTSGDLNDTQAATNNGNTVEDLNIKGQSSANWTLTASPGANQYSHQFCKTGSGSPDPCDASPTWTSLTASYQSLATSVAISSNQRFDLRVNTPTSTTATAQQSVDVTVQAVQH